MSCMVHEACVLRVHLRCACREMRTAQSHSSHTKRQKKESMDASSRHQETCSPTSSRTLMPVLTNTKVAQLHDPWLEPPLHLCTREQGSPSSRPWLCSLTVGVVAVAPSLLCSVCEARALV